MIISSFGLAAFGGTEIIKDKLLDNVEDITNNRPPSPGQGEFNLIDVNSFINKITQNIIFTNINNLDVDTKILIYCLLLLIIGVYLII